MMVRRLEMSMLAARMGPLAIILYAAAPAPSSLPSARSLDHATEADRASYVRRATIWTPSDVASKDFMVGPPRKDSFPFDEKVSCDYIQPEEPMGGTTPKFACALSPDDVVKVKYGRKNGEVYAAVASSRLLWALGFGADSIYPVQVTCRNCPIEPWWWSTEKRVPERTYELATIERRLPGERIESKPDQGWAWPELDTVDESAGGAPRAHRDALKLLMVLLQNSDSKPDNQKLVCPPDAVSKDAAGNQTCSRPLMYVKDLGCGFGHATTFDNSKVDLAAWETEAIWKDKARCVGNLKKSMQGTYGDPTISEAGRKFLADLLAQLTDKQINDMFTVARVNRYDEHPERNRPIADWVRAFNTKRAEIVNQRCPS
jgi:hypothetical protein